MLPTLPYIFGRSAPLCRSLINGPAQTRTSHAGSAHIECKGTAHAARRTTLLARHRLRRLASASPRPVGPRRPSNATSTAPEPRALHAQACRPPARCPPSSGAPNPSLSPPASGDVSPPPPPNIYRSRARRAGQKRPSSRPLTTLSPPFSVLLCDHDEQQQRRVQDVRQVVCPPRSSIIRSALS
jgi:hypothetical protein